MMDSSIGWKSFLFSAAVAGMATAPVAAPGALSGLILDRHTGEPLAGAWVRLSEKSGNKQPAFDSIETGADGAFRFAGLQPIAEIAFGYHLRVLQERYGVHVSGLIQLQSGEDKKIDIRLEKIQGLVVRVVDSAGGEPLAGARIALRRPRAANPGLFEPGFNVFTALSDSLGWAVFEGLWPGAAELTAARAGYRTRYLRDSLEGIAFRESVTVVLSGQAVPGGKTIVGIKRTVSGAVVRGEQVHFTCVAAADTFLLYDLTWKEPVPAGQDSGRFVIEGIPEGCAGGTLRTRNDSVQVVLTGTETKPNFTIQDPPRPLALQGPPSARPDGPAIRRGLEAYTATGRKKSVSAGRAPRRP
jgi:5-hydroxyisourate hydrolase-like protein (transthyretin family)